MLFKGFVMTDFVVLENQKRGVELFGAARQLWYDKSPEVLLSGPYDCAKTFGALTKIHALMLKYPGAKCLIVRKSYKALLPSAYASYTDKILPYPPGHPDCPVEVFGGGTPQIITYPNGSTIRLGGLDVPEKVLSAEYDIVFVPQAEELILHEWEQVANRANGRAGNMPYAQVIGDANPGPPKHWILARNKQLREDGSPVLKIYWAKHTDNPTIYQRDYSYTPAPGEERRLVLDSSGNPVLTESGKQRMANLKALTGLRYKRGYLGLWVGAEGTVYDNYDEAVHVIDPFPIPRDWQRFCTVDFGYTHPFVCQWWAMDNDGRLYRYREMYHTRRTVNEHIHGVFKHEEFDNEPLYDGLGNPILTQTAKGILDYIKEDEMKPSQIVFVCDHDAEDRATMQRAGLTTLPARKSIREGIDATLERFKPAGDGKPRIFLMRGALVDEDEYLKQNYYPVTTEEEIGNYVWRERSGTEDRPKDELPVDKDNHGCDAMRYAVMHANRFNAARPQYMKYA